MSSKKITRSRFVQSYQVTAEAEGSFEERFNQKRCDSFASLAKTRNGFLTVQFSEDTYLSSGNFELDFRVGLSSWTFELDFRVGFSSWTCEFEFDSEVMS